MAKITRHGGLTDQTKVQVLLPGVAPRIVAEHGPELVELPEGTQIGGFLPPQGDEVDLPPIEENPCPGNSSQTSPVKPPTSDEPPKRGRRKRAPTTENPSSRTRKGAGSTARGATTNTRATDD